jgi:hypothetical protein
MKSTAPPPSINFFTAIAILPENPGAPATFTLVSTPPSYLSICDPSIIYKVVKEGDNTPQEKGLTEITAPTSEIKPTTDLADKFYPNPVSQTAYYEVEMPETSEGNIQVVDIQGRLLSQKDLQQGANKVEFDLSEMPNGMYFYKVMVDKKISKTGKFVVQH